MGVVVFTKVLGHAKSQSLRTLRVLGLSDFTSPFLVKITHLIIVSFWDFLDVSKRDQIQTKLRL